MEEGVGTTLALPSSVIAMSIVPVLSERTKGTAAGLKVSFMKKERFGPAVDSTKRVNP